MRQKTDRPGIVKEVAVGALLNTDNTALNNYKKNRMKTRKVYGLTEQVDILKREIEELKSQIKILIDRKG